MKKTLVTILLFVLILFSSGCYVKVEEDFYVNQAKPLVVTIGDKIKLDNISYDKSSNILLEKEDGIYANEIGSIVVNTDDGIYFVEVVEEKIVINAEANLLLNIGDETIISVNVMPSDKNQEVFFTSSDSEIISVSNDGKVKALSVGIARVIIKSSTYSISKELTFFVMDGDEKYYDTIINNIITSQNQNIDLNSNMKILEGIINSNKESIVGVKAHSIYNGVIINDIFGSGVVYKMNINYLDGTKKENVNSIENETNIKNFEYYVITCKHLVAEQDVIKIHLGEDIEDIDAELIQYDSKIDLAVLKFSSFYYLPTCKIGDSNDIDKGEFIISIGNGFNQTTMGTSTFGVISATKRYIGTDTDGDGIRDWDSEYIQHDATINNGDSGSVVVNLKGEVIAINSTRIVSAKYNNMAFAIPMNLVMEIVEQLEQGIRPQRATLGVQIIDVYDYNLSPEQFQQLYPGISIPSGLKYGFYITGVDKGSVSEKAGILPGDIIIGFNDVDIKYSYQLRVELGKFMIGSGQTCEVKIIRNNETIVLELVF